MGMNTRQMMDLSDIEKLVEANKPKVRRLLKLTESRRRLATFLSSLRYSRGFSQSDVAERSGLSLESVMELEGALGDMPSKSVILQYVDGCDVSRDYAAEFIREIETSFRSERSQAFAGRPSAADELDDAADVAADVDAEHS